MAQHSVRRGNVRLVMTYKTALDRVFGCIGLEIVCQDGTFWNVVVPAERADRLVGVSHPRLHAEKVIEIVLDSMGVEDGAHFRSLLDAPV